MKNMYFLIGFLVIVLFINSYLNNSLKKNKNNDDVSVPQSTSISQELSKGEPPLLIFEENKIDETPIKIIRNENKPIILNPDYLKTDIISANPIDSTEYHFVNENGNNAWSEINVSQHPSYHTSKIDSGFTNPGGFFKDNNIFNDKTSPNSENHLPDRCIINENDNIICSFNDRLHNIPPRTISKENKVLEDIGSITKNKIYDNDKVINGGAFYGEVSGSLPTNEDYVTLQNLPKMNYSF
jgi:hypothetical protein